ncbi:hypothetical protein VOLCADRAFT_88772 [Volvox carteri f. nagariensis]|uniref:Nucleolar complex protein 2 n=1 Tax=Volvox carteri f. nagariensis TaxID=3068 RepID=D8TPW9_VOLCA|nr:uncharacterized protein VOLCADRAFT_88772 [Volvox carteri f. nagariensis]EFJ50433.1 hypothetical protein VOLCADRAFT_88772 [Volvox carteri f. nagariensis]|eukprot:XP_002948558.1 hypothetical protein VOLCADRAFT_88772 [Volvox carteri f. nagariensis]
MGVNKATKKMARKGQLKNAIHARRKHKRISHRRQPHKDSRATKFVKAGDEFRKEGAAKKKKGAFDDTDAEEFLQARRRVGGFEDDFDEEDVDDDDVDVLEGDDDDIDGSDDDEMSEEGDEEGVDDEGDDDGDDGLSSDLLDGVDDKDGVDDDDDDEEEEEEEEGTAGGDPVVQDNKRLKGEIAKHKAQLEALREKDPEFYAYLKEADADLLGFRAGEDDEDDDEEEDDDDEEDEDGARGGEKAQKAVKKKGADAAAVAAEEDGGPDGSEEGEEEPGSSGRVDVTSALLARWCTAARGGPDGRGPPALGSFGFLVRAYRLACHYGDPQEDADSGRLRITSSTVYNTIMMFMLREADAIIRRLLGLPPPSATAAAAGAGGGAAANQQQQQQSKKGKKEETDLAKNPRLATQTGVFVPVAPLALEALEWGDLRRSPGGGGGGGRGGTGGGGGAAAVAGGCPDLSLQLKLGKQLLRSPPCQEEVVTQILELLCDHLATWSCSIAFPELAHVPLLHLRRFIKGCRVERFKCVSGGGGRAAKQLQDAVQRNVAWVGVARDRVDFGPKDTAKVQAFLRTEREAGRSPLQQLAAAMATRAARRAAARRAEDVNLGGSGGGDRKRARREAEDEDEEDSDDDDIELAAAAAANGDGGGSSDEELEEGAGGEVKSGKKASKRQRGGGKRAEDRSAPDCQSVD